MERCSESTLQHIFIPNPNNTRSHTNIRGLTFPQRLADSSGRDESLGCFWKLAQRPHKPATVRDWLTPITALIAIVIAIIIITVLFLLCNHIQSFQMDAAAEISLRRRWFLSPTEQAQAPSKAGVLSPARSPVSAADPRLSQIPLPASERASSRCAHSPRAAIQVDQGHDILRNQFPAWSQMKRRKRRTCIPVFAPAGPQSLEGSDKCVWQQTFCSRRQTRRGRHKKTNAVLHSHALSLFTRCLDLLRRLLRRTTACAEAPAAATILQT